MNYMSIIQVHIDCAAHYVQFSNEFVEADEWTHLTIRMSIKSQPMINWVNAFFCFFFFFFCFIYLLLSLPLAFIHPSSYPPLFSHSSSSYSSSSSSSSSSSFPWSVYFSTLAILFYHRVDFILDWLVFVSISSTLNWRHQMLFVQNVCFVITADVFNSSRYSAFWMI